jgi:c-di-GMP-binding flagellar brake protein YcgR
MNIHNLKAGDRVTITEGDGEYTYSSIVHEKKIDSTITVYMPYEAKGLLRIRLGSMVEVVFAAEDAQYRFDASIKAIYEVDRVKYLDIMPVSELRRVQRRQFYRLKITLDVYIRLLEQEGSPQDDGWKKTFTEDISGDGMRLKSFEAIPDGSLLDCMIRLRDRQIIRLQGRVLEVFEAEDEILPYRLRIEIQGISEQIQNEIIRFIFDRQREMRAKML